ncbi:DUF805 domain-containing protein [Aequorivita marina]|jgi:uncharacterized membrane protein YhaH (DUF805 family)|uniref:DUF805 domain-containing protein n=1 Tax=Aequorivita marina TaxID=3073654 RepID=UPI00287657B0|nr:DUF805 domain-containing protein [Aequorivita sp. S2608]MDS1298736.1 DUF805 domain-containing protein [Aequorivita sp. S2608]
MFKNPFSFEGRIRRTEYGLSFIIYAVAAGIINVIVEESRGDAAFLMIAYIPLLWFLWAQGAKRCHDVGNSGWWQLIPFYALWLIFQDGQPGVNQYGENPKGIQVMGGQTYQGSSNNPTQGNSNPQINTGSGYQGGYSGGHNNPNTNFNQAGQESNRDGYKDGDLYN